MSKSYTRVKSALDASGVHYDMQHAEELTRTAAEAAAEHGCAVDQIAKSIIWQGAATGDALLFITAGGNRVDEARAAALAGEDLLRADAAFIREKTGFAIGGVAPLGHTGPVRTWLDRRLTEFDVVWAAAGTPRDNFAIAPGDLARIADATIADFTA